MLMNTMTKRQFIVGTTSLITTVTLGGHALAGEQKPAEKPVYSLDGKLVGEKEFARFADYGFLIVSGNPVDGETVEVVYRAFTSLDRYIKFGKDNRIPLDSAVSFEEQVSEFAGEFRVPDKFDEKFRMPEKYTEFEKKTYQQSFPRQDRSRTALTVLHKEYWGGPSWSMHFYAPWFCCGWNNSISAFTPIGIYGVTILYDKSF